MPPIGVATALVWGSRCLSLDSQVVSVAVVDSGGSDGSTFVLGDTFRAFSNAAFYQLRRRIEEVITLQARVHGSEASVDFFENQSFYPPMVNDPRLYEHVKGLAKELLGAAAYRDVSPMMGTEDFSFYSQVIPAGFYYVGVRNETLGSVHTRHSPSFMINERPGGGSNAVPRSEGSPGGGSNAGNSSSVRAG